MKQLKSPATKKRPQKRAIDKKTAFLAAFVVTASITEAAAAVGMDRGLHYDWLREDPEYPARFEQAMSRAGDTLVDDAVEWARKGIAEPVIYQGQICVDAQGKPLVIRRRSEGHLGRLLKAFKPEKFGNKVELTGKDGGPIETEFTINFVRPAE